MKPQFRQRLVEMPTDSHSNLSFASDSHSNLSASFTDKHRHPRGSSNGNLIKSEEPGEILPNMNDVVPDGHPSSSSSLVPPKFSFQNHGSDLRRPDSAPSGGWALDGTDPRSTTTAAAALKYQIDATRLALEKDEQEVLQAKLNEASINQTMVTLTAQRQELKVKLQETRDELDIAKTEQGEAAAETLAKEQQKKKRQTALDHLLSQLYAESNAPKPVSGKTILPVKAAPVPRRVSATGKSRPLQETSGSDPQRPKKMIKTEQQRPKTMIKTEQPQQQQKKTKKRMTRQHLFKLSQDAAAGCKEASAQLIDVVTKTPRKELREILGLHNTSYIHGLDSYESIDIMRVLSRGKAHLRTDLRARLQADPEKKSWLLNGRLATVLISRVMADCQERIIYILKVPEASIRTNRN